MVETAGQLMAADYVAHCELQFMTLGLLLTQSDLVQTMQCINVHTLFFGWMIKDVYSKKIIPFLQQYEAFISNP